MKIVIYIVSIVLWIGSMIMFVKTRNSMFLIPVWVFGIVVGFLTGELFIK